MWRNRIRACFIICGCTRWSIGSTTCIPILDEPSLHNGECIDNNISGAHFVCNASINCLLDTYVKSCNEPAVRQVFSDDLASKILNTPLIEQAQHDMMIWKAEKNGRYSVRSAYRLCVTELVDLSHLYCPGYWSGIWKLISPPKVKNLI